MAVTVTTVVDMGAVTLGQNEFLFYSLFPSAGNPIWSFSCADRKGIFQVTNNPHPQYNWAVLNGPAPNPFVVSTDRARGIADIYGIFLVFAQVQSYRITVAKRPLNVTVQDITLTAQLRIDTFPVPLTLTTTT
jgi:hypothetical protein